MNDATTNADALPLSSEQDVLTEVLPETTLNATFGLTVIFTLRPVSRGARVCSMEVMGSAGGGDEMSRGL